MAVDIQEYLNKMTELHSAVQKALRIATTRSGINQRMKDLSDEIGDTGVALTSKQKGALLDSQKKMTDNLAPLLAAAQAAITP